MKRRFRLTRSTDFQRVRRNGKTYAHPLVVLVTAPNELSQARIGIVTGRALGGAVERNRVKRRLRACLSQRAERVACGWDLVFLARKPLGGAGFQDLCAAVDLVLKKAGIWHD